MIIIIPDIMLFLGLKPFGCQFCGRAFRQRSQQQGHEATHSNMSAVAVSMVQQQQQNHPVRSTSALLAAVDIVQHQQQQQQLQ